MTLADLFTLLNTYAIRMAEVNGHLELRGPHVPPEVVEGVRTHKQTLLSLLAAQPTTEAKDEEEVGARPSPLSCRVSTPAGVSHAPGASSFETVRISDK